MKLESHFKYSRPSIQLQELDIKIVNRIMRLNGESRTAPPTTYKKLIFNKGTKAIKWKSIFFSASDAGTIKYPICKKENFDLYLMPC